MAVKKFQFTVGNFIVVVIVAAAVLFYFGGNLWSEISIARHAQMTQGIVIGVSRGGILYHYTVNGHDYSGSGVGDYNRSYPKGTALEVRYSSVHPSFSTIDDSFLLEKQLLCGLVIFGGIFLTVYLGRRRQQTAPL